MSWCWTREKKKRTESWLAIVPFSVGRVIDVTDVREDGSRSARTWSKRKEHPRDNERLL